MDYVDAGYVFSYDKDENSCSDLFPTHTRTDIPDQTAIVRQYMRFTGQISSAATVSQSIKRALQM